MDGHKKTRDILAGSDGFVYKRRLLMHKEGTFSDKGKDSVVHKYGARVTQSSGKFVHSSVQRIHWPVTSATNTTKHGTVLL